MNIIEKRLKALNVPPTEYASIGKSETAAIVERSGELSERANDVRTFSIAESDICDVSQTLRDLCAADQLVFACWPNYGEAFRLSWELLLRHFSDLWYPSSDDLLVVSANGSWLLEVNHEETVRFLALSRGRLP